METSVYIGLALACAVLGLVAFLHFNEAKKPEPAPKKKVAKKVSKKKATKKTTKKKATKKTAKKTTKRKKKS